MLIINKNKPIHQHKTKKYRKIKVINIKVIIKTIVPVYIKQSTYIQYIDIT